MISYQPYKYKSVPGWQVALYNRIFHHDPGLVFQMGTDSYSLSLAPEVPEAIDRVPLTAHVRMDDRIGFALCPEEQLLPLLMADTLSLSELKELPEQIRGIALEAALEKVMDHIDQSSGASTRIERLAESQDVHKYPLTVGFRMMRRRDGFCARGAIRSNEDGMQWIAARLGRLPARVGRPLGHLPVTGYIEVGDCQVTQQELRGLGPCDILLASDIGALYNRRLHIRFSSSLVLAGDLVEPDRILVQDVITDQGKVDSMTTETQAATQSTGVPVEEVPVKLTFEIGRTDISMGELCRLQSGYTFALAEQVDMNRPVTIRANGVVVGAGELVLMDDHLGVRVLAFNEDRCPAEK